MEDKWISRCASLASPWTLRIPLAGDWPKCKDHPPRMGVWLLSICYTHKYWCNLLFKSHLLFVITRMLAKTCVDWNVQITAEVWVLHFCLLYASMRLFAVVSILLIVSTTSISGRIQYECSFVVGGSVYQEKDGRWVFTREELTSNIAFGHYERDMNTTGIFPHPLCCNF